jgi:hypothetical protein
MNKQKNDYKQYIVTEYDNTSWLKNIFATIGNFLSKVFNTILHLVKQPSINENDEIDDDFNNNMNNEKYPNEEQEYIPNDNQDLEENMTEAIDVLNGNEVVINSNSNNQEQDINKNKSDDYNIEL